MPLDENVKEELAELMLKMSSNPKTRKQLLKLTKEVNPNTPIPEIDVESEIDARVKAVKDESDKKFQELADERMKEKLESQRSKAMQKYGLDDAQMKKMEEMMTKGELPADYNWAPQLFSQQIEPVGSTSYTLEYGPISMPSGEGLMENEHNWSVKEAHTIVDELRRKSSKPF